MEVMHTIPTDLKELIRKRLTDAQTNLLASHNITRKNKSYNVGDRVFVKQNKRN